MARKKLAGQMKEGSDQLIKIKSLEDARRNEKEAVEKLSEIADEETALANELTDGTQVLLAIQIPEP